MGTITIQPAPESPRFEITQLDIKGYLIDTLQEMIKQAFPNENVKVIRGWPQSPAVLPCITVWRLNDEQGEDFIGQYLVKEQMDDGTYKEVEGYAMREQWEIRVWALNPELQEQIYFAAKGTILLFERELAANGVQNIRLSDGRDEAMMDQHSESMYMTPMHLSLENPISIQQIDVPGEVTEVDVTEKLS